MYGIVNTEQNGLFFEGAHFMTSTAAISFCLPSLFLLDRQRLRMLLAVKAIDVQRGVWGLSSVWDVSVHAHVVAGRCVYKLVCPLAAVTVM